VVEQVAGRRPMTVSELEYEIPLCSRRMAQAHVERIALVVLPR
jgi:hypothetical protein